MKLAYLDCASGISGDMTLGALVDAGVPLARLQAGIDSLDLPSCHLVAEEVHRKGFRATKIHVRHEPEHAHRHLHHILELIASSALSAAEQDLAARIFTHLGQAEAHVHGTSIRKVHFHEVGAVDSIADIVGAAIGWTQLNVDRICCSPVPTGTGTMTIAHGKTSVPAPATAELLKGIPLAASDVEAELTTPTGAAIIKTLCTEFGPLPSMSIETIGVGAGDRDFPSHGNILRLLVGTAVDPLAQSDQILVLETNLDDTTGEIIGHCTERLLTAGALDVYTTPIHMKKNRPAVKLTVLCGTADRQRMEDVLFDETGTLGIRRLTAERTTLPRQTHSVSTAWGQVEGKLATLPGGRPRFSPEYESCRQIAATHQLPVAQVIEAAQRAFGE